METHTITVEAKVGEQIIINVVSAKKTRVRKEKAQFDSRNAMGDFTMVTKSGEPKSRLEDEQLIAIFSDKAATFTPEASKRLGGVSGLAVRISSAISNVKTDRKSGKTRYDIALSSKIPALKDFEINEDADGRVHVQEKF